MGIFSVYAASYQYDDASFFDMTNVTGKQILWGGISISVLFMLLLIDFREIDAYAYVLYGGMMLILLVTIFVARDVKGSRSWLTFGSFSIQPAEFAKTFTALCLAKLFSSYNFSLNKDFKNYLAAGAIILTPILLIIMQKETGSALIYTSLAFMLYREGMSGLVLVAALSMVVFFVVSIKFTETMIWGIPSGEFAVFIMIILLLLGMLFIYCKAFEMGRNTLLGFVAAFAIGGILSTCGIAVNGLIFFLVTITLAVLYIVIFIFNEDIKKILITIGFVLMSVGFLFSVNYAFNDILKPYQQMRIKVALGIEDDIRGVGYNVNQSKIAIGSGGLFGKGYLNGTQTKLKYVPEQHTDFIFCTIGEEKGFVGCVTVLGLFLFLILRIISIAERQTSAFGRVYAYCVASYLIFHVAINIGMVIGLCPVIGIPLPLFSYGGSSLLGFSLMFGFLLKIDAVRSEHVNY